MHILHHVPVFVNTTLRLYNLPSFTRASWREYYITGRIAFCTFLFRSRSSGNYAELLKLSSTFLSLICPTSTRSVLICQKTQHCPCHAFCISSASRSPRWSQSNLPARLPIFIRPVHSPYHFNILFCTVLQPPFLTLLLHSTVYKLHTQQFPLQNSYFLTVPYPLWRLAQTTVPAWSSLLAHLHQLSRYSNRAMGCVMTEKWVWTPRLRISCDVHRVRDGWGQLYRCCWVVTHSTPEFKASGAWRWLFQ